MPRRRGRGGTGDSGARTSCPGKPGHEGKEYPPRAPRSKRADRRRPWHAHDGHLRSTSVPGAPATRAIGPRSRHRAGTPADAVTAVRPRGAAAIRPCHRRCKRTRPAEPRIAAGQSQRDRAAPARTQQVNAPTPRRPSRPGPTARGQVNRTEPDQARAADLPPRDQAERRPARASRTTTLSTVKAPATQPPQPSAAPAGRSRAPGGHQDRGDAGDQRADRQTGGDRHDLELDQAELRAGHRLDPLGLPWPGRRRGRHRAGETRPDGARDPAAPPGPAPAARQGTGRGGNGSAAGGCVMSKSMSPGRGTAQPGQRRLPLQLVGTARSG